MADNISVTPGAGVTVATDEVGGVHHQCVKVYMGGNGTATPVSSTSPMPVSLSPETMDKLDAAAPPLTENGNVKVEMVDSTGAPVPISATNWDDGLQPSESYMGKTGTAGTVIQVAPVVDTTVGYVTNDILFVSTLVPGVARVQGGLAMINGVTYTDFQDLAYPVDLYISASPVTLGPINGPAIGEDLDIARLKKLCRLDTGDFDDLGGARLATKNGLGCMFKADLGSQDMYVVGIIRNNATYTATDSLRIKFDVVQF
jgi:hypothetical protein